MELEKNIVISELLNNKDSLEITKTLNKNHDLLLHYDNIRIKVSPLIAPLYTYINETIQRIHANQFFVINYYINNSIEEILKTLSLLYIDYIIFN